MSKQPERWEITFIAWHIGYELSAVLVKEEDTHNEAAKKAARATLLEACDPETIQYIENPENGRWSMSGANSKHWTSGVLGSASCIAIRGRNVRDTAFPLTFPRTALEEACFGTEAEFQEEMERESWIGDLLNELLRPR